MHFVSLTLRKLSTTLPETNITHENPIFLGKYHQNGGFSMAMLVYRRVSVARSRHSVSRLRTALDEAEDFAEGLLQAGSHGGDTPPPV